MAANLRIFTRSWLQFAKWLKNASKHQKVFLVVQLVFACITCGFLFRIPAPGWAVAIMAVVAAAMSLHEDMKSLQKASWMGLIACLLVIELRAISQDRREAQKQAQSEQNARDAEFHQILKTEKQNFDTTAKRLEDAYKQSQDNFAATIDGVAGVLRTTQKVASVSQRNLDAISGEDSYPCIEPDYLATTADTISINIWNEGLNVLTGVEVSMYDSANYVRDRQRGDRHPLFIGTLSAGWPKMLPSVKPNLGKDGISKFYIEITAQNGLFTESISFRRSRSGFPWAWRYSLTRQQLLKEPSKLYPGAPARSLVGFQVEHCHSYAYGWSDERTK